MIATIVSMFRAIKVGLKNPDYQLFILAVVWVLVGGTLFYHFYEGWSWIDSMYFVVISLTTVGYGDFQPSTELSRFVTIGFVFFGVSLLGAFISLIAKNSRIARHALRGAREDSSDDSAGSGGDAD